jgi:hypothetical protein
MILIFFPLFIAVCIFVQVEAVLEDFERRLAGSEDKGAVSPCTSLRAIYLRLP